MLFLISVKQDEIVLNKVCVPVEKLKNLLKSDDKLRSMAVSSTARKRVYLFYGNTITFTRMINSRF